MRNGSSLALSVLSSLTLVSLAVAQQSGAESDLRYDRDIRPLLADRCFKCHGPDPVARRADLRLDEFDLATAPRKDGAAIVPGKPDLSVLLARIASEDPDEMMPPPKSGKVHLQPAERERIAQWIRSGAKYEPHWSFALPVRNAAPAVQNASWARNPIDRFVLAELERRGMAPNSEADRPTLARRLFLAVTGLPPTPEELAAFLSDPSPGAYDALVKKLLDTEPYKSRSAERLAVPWLDAARYADTSGIHMDAGRQIWKYRDWVIDSYRDNKPFDQFVVEQIAGDLLPNPTQSQLIGSGFHRCHVTTDEGGAIDEEYLVEYAVDRVSTTGSVFLGLTLGCARCHDHKYDPVSQEDFYKFYAYFNSIEEPGLYSQAPDPNRALEPFVAVPTMAQQQQRTQLQADLEGARKALDERSPDEEAQQRAFQQERVQRAMVQWAATSTIAAKASEGVTMTIEPDGSVRASGANPAKDVHTITLRTDAKDLRMLHLHAIGDVTKDGRVGRAENGNVVLQAITVEIAKASEPNNKQPLALTWAWADVEQTDGDYRVVNALSKDDGLGWAVGAHTQKPGPRNALFLTEQPFGFEGGTEITVTLHYDSQYAMHTFGHVRLSAGAIGEAGLAMLPETRGGYFATDAFARQADADLYAQDFGPETATTIDRKARFGDKKKNGWRYRPEFREAVVNSTPEGSNAIYIAQNLYAPTVRERELSLGSDDGFRLFVDGKQVAENRTDRAAAPDQDKVKLSLSAGQHLVTLKVVNTNGQGGFYQRYLTRPDELTGPLVAMLLPEFAQTALAEPMREAWRLTYSPGYSQKKQRIADLEQQVAAIDKSVPRAMVMRERPQPRETFVLKRGQYDQPDKSRPVRRGIPAALGKAPADSPDNRLGLARWLTAADNPLVARVQINRLWELMFGQGIVRTTEDFGMQGEWPSHPELLDWLALEFREQGWNVRHMLELMLTSATFRQDSRVQPNAQQVDADNRLLSWFPRRRLSAEQLRDQALYLSGFLVERVGGPSVKPYQPDGLWQEVAMTQSNTRFYERGNGDDLFRRSLYTYWKRACPPPAMLTFDAPTREFCTVRRAQTNTPLQALVLWNDEQFVEAARGLAVRTLAAANDDAARLDALFVACTSRAPSPAVRTRTLQALQTYRDRYAKDPAAATALLAVGTKQAPSTVPAGELAAWTMLANAALNLDSTICNP